MLQNVHRRIVLCSASEILSNDAYDYRLRMHSEEITFTARPKIKSQSQIYRYSRSKFCLPHRPEISDFFDLCLHLVSVFRDLAQCKRSKSTRHGLLTPNEGISERNLKIWADVADKICFGRTKKFGSGSGFSAVQ